MRQDPDHYKRSEHRRYSLLQQPDGCHVSKDGKHWRTFPDFYTAREAVESDIETSNDNTLAANSPRVLGGFTKSSSERNT